MHNMKKYLLTAMTLGVIAASSAAIIGLTNLITKDKILENEANKVKAGIVALFGSEAEIKKEQSVTDYKYVNYAYTITNATSTLDAYAFRTTGSNSYGKISLLIGFKKVATDYKFEAVSNIVDEQTFASTLEDNYISTINDGSRNIEDVTCGATYGATLVRDMIKDAQSVITSGILEG